MMKNTTTVLTVKYNDFYEEAFYNVHPDNHYATDSGFLVIEFDEDNSPIIYIPISLIRRFDTVEVSVPCDSI